jgi:hypothetical protein
VHYGSLLASFTLTWSVLFLVQFYTIGLLPWVNMWRVGNVSVKELVFSLVALVVINKFFSFSSPYERKE